VIITNLIRSSRLIAIYDRKKSVHLELNFLPRSAIDMTARWYQENWEARHLIICVSDWWTNDILFPNLQARTCAFLLSIFRSRMQTHSSCVPRQTKPTCDYRYLRLLGHFHTQVTSLSDQVCNYDFGQGLKSVVLKSICVYHNVQYSTKNLKTYFLISPLKYSWWYHFVPHI
jgi:hypothetical protein